MKTHVDKSQENHSHSRATNTTSSKQQNIANSQMVDNRPEAIQMRKLQELANNHAKKTPFNL